MKKWKEKIPVANTVVGEEEAKAVYEVVKSGWLSMGRKVAEFEEEFAQQVSSRHAVSVNSGTAALHTVLSALNIGKGEEVIIPSLTFISTANVVLYQGATPVLAECNPLTYAIEADEVRRLITERTKAIIPVDMNGMPCDYDELLKVEDEYHLPIIWDSAESLGALYKNRKVGSIGKIHCFSFFPNKNITTGEGGMICLEDERLYELMCRIRNQGQERRYHHTHLGYNYRMTEMQAALGICQLKRLEATVDAKNTIAAYYNRELDKIPGISLPEVPSYVTRHSWYMYTISVDESLRDEVVKKLHERNIETRLSFPPVHIQPYYQRRFNYSDQSLPVTSASWSRLINIPIWSGMGKERQDFIIDSLETIMKEVN